MQRKQDEVEATMRAIINTSTGRRLLTAGIGLSLTGAGVFTACAGSITDVAADSQNVQADAVDISGAVQSLTADLALTSEQREAVAGIQGRIDGDDPGRLWYAAGELQAVLTSEQIQQVAEVQEAARQEMRAQMEQRLEQWRARNDAGQGRGHRSGPSGMQGFGRIDAGDIELSEDQQASLRLLREEYEPRIRELMEQMRTQGASREELRESAETIRAELHAETLAVLDEDQKAELDEWRATRTQRMEKRRDEVSANREARRQDNLQRHESEADARAEALSLTPEQVAAYEELAEEARARFQEAREAGEQPFRRGLARQGFAAGQRTGFQDDAGADILTQNQQEIVTIHRALSWQAGRERLARQDRAGIREGRRPFRRGQ